MTKEVKLTLIVKNGKCHILNDLGKEIKVCDTLDEIKEAINILALSMALSL